MNPYDPYHIASTVLLAITVALAALFVVVKRTFYTILLLAFIGVAVAAQMALAGFTYLAVFHAIMYVGAAVAFMLFTMAVIGEERGTSIRHSASALVAAVIVGILLGAPVVTVVADAKLTPLREDAWIEAATRLVVDYWFAFLVILVAIVSILVEVVAIARRGGSL
jgi:NADH-quinone oxidoreductase subunit J